MSIGENIIKEIEEKSENFTGIAVLYDLYDLDVNLRRYYKISSRIREILGETVKVDKRLMMDTIIKKQTEVDFIREYPDDIYTYRAKDYNIWISSIFIKEILNVNDIIPDEMFKL